MTRVLIIGGGIVGTCAAMMLANDDHEVTVLERDPRPPPTPELAWDEWERRGVNQFRLLHFFLARFRHVVDRQLPGLTDALRAAGALTMNPLRDAPAEITGGWREGDERHDVITARRPVAESVIAGFAAGTPGLTIRRGVGVRGLLTSTNGTLHVTGAVTDDGEQVEADIVIDAGGRRSAVAGWLRELRSPGPDELIEDCGFVYYARHFRSSDGSVPFALGGLLQPYGSLSVLTLPADNGTWGVGLITSSRDPQLRRLKDLDTWTRVVGAYPLVAHWIDAEPLTDIDVMAKIEDRRRTYVVDGEPVVTGLLALGDAWACTNPSLGRGISIGLTHAEALRKLLRDHQLEDRRGLALAWHEVTADVVGPFVDETLVFDRHRLAEIDAVIDGRTYTSDDPVWTTTKVLEAAAANDPDSLRGFLDVVGLVDTVADVAARPGLLERAAAAVDPNPLPGPDRAELLSLVGT